MTIKFNNQELIQSNRINELKPFYELLDATRVEDNIILENGESVKAIPIIYKWADSIRKKDIPYAITKSKNGSGGETVHFWVKGEKKLADRD